MALEFWTGDVGGELDDDELTPWNTVQIDGALFPAVDAPFVLKSISGGGVGFDVDRRKRKNRSGRKKVETGAKSPQWQMVFLMWTPGQYSAWQAILPQINPKLAANRSKVRRIYHPFLADFEITQAFIYRIDFPQWVEGLMAEVTIYFEDVGSPDKDAKKTLKPTNNPQDSQVAIDKDFVSDDGPPAVPQSRP